MLIKITKNGNESEWFPLTKKLHRTLLLDAPDVVFVRIDSLYPNSPESGQIVQLDFPCFTLLARDFVLEEKRQEKRDERHRDRRAMEDIDPTENRALSMSVDEICIRRELGRILSCHSAILTPTQRRRLRLFAEGLTLTEIGQMEGVTHKAIGESVSTAIEKIKKFLD